MGAEVDTHDPDVMATGRRRRRARWVIAALVVLAAAGVALAITEPFSSGGSGQTGVSGSADPTGLQAVTRQDLTSQTQVSATLGYAGSYSISAPSGYSPDQIAQAEETVTADRQTLSADEQSESDASIADDQQIAADQSTVDADQSTSRSDRATESDDCAGSKALSAPCAQATEKVSDDQAALDQAGQQLEMAKSTATTDYDQNEAKIQSDETKLQGDEETLSSEHESEVDPGTTYTSLPQVGEIVKEDQTLYSLDDEPVPLLYGSTSAYRAFYLGMSDGSDIGELTRDLIALGFGAGLSESDHYSSSTAAAVRRWQSALGLQPTGEILLGEVVFEPGPIRVTSVTPSVGSSIEGGAGGGDAGTGGSGGGGTVLSATSDTRQVSIALDAAQSSEVSVGDRVTITLPDDVNTPGVISSVGTVATAGQSGGSPTITVEVTPSDPRATLEWDEAPVTVIITTQSVANALVVPVDALLALPDGDYAVEVADPGGEHHLVDVSLGLFDDAQGLVQVTGSGLAAGDEVVVPNL